MNAYETEIKDIKERLKMTDHKHNWKLATIATNDEDVRAIFTCNCGRIKIAGANMGI